MSVSTHFVQCCAHRAVPAESAILSRSAREAERLTETGPQRAPSVAGSVRSRRRTSVAWRASSGTEDDHEQRGQSLLCTGLPVPLRAGPGHFRLGESAPGVRADSNRTAGAPGPPGPGRVPGGGLCRDSDRRGRAMGGPPVIVVSGRRGRARRPGLARGLSDGAHCSPAKVYECNHRNGPRRSVVCSEST